VPVGAVAVRRTGGRYTAEGGLDQIVALPVRKVTSVTFGGTGLPATAYAS
jgi:sugar lactone lactonase YvrE